MKYLDWNMKYDELRAIWQDLSIFHLKSFFDISC